MFRGVLLIWLVCFLGFSVWHVRFVGCLVLVLLVWCLLVSWYCCTLHNWWFGFGLVWVVSVFGWVGGVWNFWCFGGFWICACGGFVCVFYDVSFLVWVYFAFLVCACYVVGCNFPVVCV